MVDRVHRCDNGEKNLRSADITGRFITPDVLLAGLHRQAITRMPRCIVGDAYETTSHVAFISVPRREISGMRPAESEGNPKALRAAYGNVGTKFPRGFE